MRWHIAQDSGTLADDMAHEEDHARVRLGPQGRIVIPAALRKTLGFREGTELHAVVREGRLVLRTREQVIRDIRARFRHLPGDRSLVDELIADRREEARREAAEMEGGAS